MRYTPLALVGLTILAFCSGCNESADGGRSRPKIGFITNAIADFWTIAEAGARAAEKEFDVAVKVAQPTSKGKLVEQMNFLRDMVSAGYDGIAITPLKPADQTPLLDEIAAKTHLITHDSDAPNSKRRCFIGVDNYAAGRQCGMLVREAIPDGGKIMMFLAGLDGDNAQRRRQGVIDELFGRSSDPSRRDPTGTVLSSPDKKYTVLGCLTDGFDRTVAKDNAVDTLTKHGDIACMVGLFEYNPPLIVEAIQQAEKTGKVQVVAFDENRATLQGIRDGKVFGTVVQDPYRYGYLSVKLLAALARGDASMIPANKIIDVPARKIVRANVDAFEAELDERLGR